MGEGILPAVMHIDKSVFDNHFRVAAGIECLGTAKSYTVHPLKILRYSVLGDVSVHPVPPDLRSCRLRRIRPSFLKFGQFCSSGRFIDLLRIVFHAG